MFIKKILLNIFIIGNLGSAFVPIKRDINIPPEIVAKNHIIYTQYDKLGEYKKYFEPNLFSEIDKRNTFDLDSTILQLKQQFGDAVVKQLSAGLPNVDNIGHKILHANNLFINDVLNNNILSHDMQKEIILTSIKIAQHGDNMGSSLLQLYYNIVDYFL